MACKSYNYSDPSHQPEIATIILAGGQGTRLFPLTQTKCKPDVSFAGRYHLIDVPISNSINSNIGNICVISQFFASSLNRHINKTFPQEPLSGGKITLLSPEETPSDSLWYKGTADAVRKSLDELLELPCEYFAILSGDQLYNMDIRQMLEYTKCMDAELTIATIPVSEQEAPRLGILKVDEKGYITDFIEKPQDPKMLEGLVNPTAQDSEKKYLASMGIYIFKRDALVRLLKEDLREDFGKHIIPTQIKQSRKTAAYIYDGYWEDIGTIKSFYEANLSLTDPSSGLNLYNEKAPIYAESIHLPSAQIKNTSINQSILCDGAIISAKEIYHSLIGMRITIGEGTVVHDSIILGNQYYSPPKNETAEYPKSFGIGENCEIRKTIIDEHCSIGNNVRLVNEKGLETYDSDHLYVRDGIIVIPAKTTLPDGFTF